MRAESVRGDFGWRGPASERGPITGERRQERHNDEGHSRAREGSARRGPGEVFILSKL
jgi:hypothetical protein